MGDADLAQRNNLPNIGEYPWDTLEAQALLDLAHELIAEVKRLEEAAKEQI